MHRVVDAPSRTALRLRPLHGSTASNMHVVFPHRHKQQRSRLITSSKASCNTSHASREEAPCGAQHQTATSGVQQTVVRTVVVACVGVVQQTLQLWARWCGAVSGAMHAHRERLRGSEVGQLCAFSLLASPILPGGFEDLLNNRIFWGSFWAWLTAQTLKIFTKKYKTGVWDVRAIFDSGGMPSSHSAMCAGLTTSIALEFGLGSPLFAIALCFTSIVMYDACGVRRHAGRTAEALNKVINELMEKEHPVTAMKLKEVLGHTPRQVVAGAVLGVAMAMYLPLPSHPIASA